MYDYSYEPRHVIFMIDNKSFYASVESVERGLNPLESVLVVMSQADNAGDGLVLASSPMAKKLFNISNVTRCSEVPIDDPRLVIAAPRMNLYIKRNLQINEIFQTFTAEEDIQPYSIDESLLDMTHSWQLFGNSPFEVARKIQVEIKKELGLYVTVGIGDNPLLAKFALDIEAKHDYSLIGEWHYEDVPDKLWPIKNLNELWSIGKRTALKLEQINIYSVYDLAHHNPYVLKQRFGIMGSQLFALSWGIDRSIIKKKYHIKEKSCGNSQVLPNNYEKQSEIEVVIRELAEQVASRLRAQHKLSACINLGVGFSYNAKRLTNSSGFAHSMKIEPTNLNKELADLAIQMFRKYWQGQPIRHLYFSGDKLSNDDVLQLDLLNEGKNRVKEKKVDETIDSIRRRFGFKSIVKTSSLCKGATAINRSKLVGGHNGGNAYD
ncbi:Y-family DNA polymerase [Companilactobacillus keshanensis]|uniref:Y-family DNA polymerase n=1 Tax=Companilactobacillus keshanensis TaxID=2486003 RepID=A0ABW4BQF6_9LACO|nr:Y-family DNA polymerase [Companilactobacillus keshanensis]